MALFVLNSLYDEHGVWDFLTKLGFGKASGLKFPGERIGKLNYEKWTQSDIASQSFGYGLSTNLLQLTRSYSIFSSKGGLIQVKLIKKIEKKCWNIIKKNTANEMKKILASVVSYEGQRQVLRCLAILLLERLAQFELLKMVAIIVKNTEEPLLGLLLLKILNY